MTHMLRLTLTNADASLPLLTVEGRLVGEWSALLEAECARILQRGARLDLDIAGLTDVDTQGLSALRRLARESVVLSGVTPIMSALLAEGERR
jgi:ABC-type transporter Mla MlaB component